MTRPLIGRTPLGQVLDGLRRGQIAFARLLINQVDDDIPHNHTPLFCEAIKSLVRFRVSSRKQENGFVGTVPLCRRQRRTKQVHRIESAVDRECVNQFTDLSQSEVRDPTESMRLPPARAALLN
jgi:hypothetical protein